MSEATVIPFRWRPTIGFDARLRLIRLDYAERIGERVTQDRMADILGVPRGTLRSWEAGNSRPADIVGTAKLIERTIGADPTWLLDLTNEGGNGPGGTPDQGNARSRWSVQFADVLPLFPRLACAG